MTTEINTQGVLTPREEQALRYIAEGKTIKDAARCMGIATATAYDHVENAKSKVAAETTPHAISILWARGYLREIAAAMLLIALCGGDAHAASGIFDGFALGDVAQRLFFARREHALGVDFGCHVYKINVMFIKVNVLLVYFSPGVDMVG